MNKYLETAIKEIEDIEAYDWIAECSNKNVYVFGAGSLATTVIDTLAKNDIIPLGLIVDHEFFKENTFLKNIKIMDWDVVEISTDSVVVIGMTDMKKGCEIKRKYPEVKTVFPSGLSFERDKQLSVAFILENQNKYNDIFNKLADEKSKNVLLAWMVSIATNREERILSECEPKQGYFSNEVIDYETIKYYLNIGAYTGDTIEEFCDVNNTYNKIYAVEGDKNLASALKNKYSSNTKIEVINKVFWDKIVKTNFGHLNNVNSVGGIVKNDEAIDDNYITTDTVDHYFEVIKDLDLISLNFRGEEYTLMGAKKTLNRTHPIVVAKVGFDRDTLFSVMNVLTGLKVDYAFYLRFKNNRANELTLYAVEKIL